MNYKNQVKPLLEQKILLSLSESEELNEILKSKLGRRIGMGLAALGVAGGIYGGVKAMSTPKLTQTSGVVIDDMYIDSERGPEVAGKPGVRYSSKQDEKDKLRRLGQEALKRGTTTTTTGGGVTTTTTSGSMTIRNGQVQPNQGQAPSAPKAAPTSPVTPKKGTHMGQGVEGEAP